MSIFVWIPSYGSAIRRENLQGCGPCMRVWSVTFEHLPAAICDEIEAFLAARAGVACFSWTPPSGVCSRWTCQSWKSIPDASGLRSLHAEFEEQAD